jgi:ZIP family zinc transporter
MLILAVTIHNIPEGMAVGVVYAGTSPVRGHHALGALALSLGIAIQNFPEGAIISMPLCAEGMSKPRPCFTAFCPGGGALAGLLTIAAAGLLVPAMPYLLSFAAGAMIYVVVEELIPEMSAGEHSTWAPWFSPWLYADDDPGRGAAINYPRGSIRGVSF